MLSDVFTAAELEVLANGGEGERGMGGVHLCGMLAVVRMRGGNVSEPDVLGGVPLDWAAYREASHILMRLRDASPAPMGPVTRRGIHQVLRRRQRRWARVLTGREVAS